LIFNEHGGEKSYEQSINLSSQLAEISIVKQKNRNIKIVNIGCHDHFVCVCEYPMPYHFVNLPKEKSYDQYKK
jgi:hypothetical protein